MTHTLCQWKLQIYVYFPRVNSAYGEFNIDKPMKKYFIQKCNDPGRLVTRCAAVVDNVWYSKLSGHSLFVWWMNYKFSATCDGFKFNTIQTLVDCWVHFLTFGKTSSDHLFAKWFSWDLNRHLVFIPIVHYKHVITLTDVLKTFRTTCISKGI